MNICISFLILRKIIILKSLEYFQFSFTDVIDIVLVAILLFYLYRLVKGTVAINIFIGLASIYLLWKLVDAFNFQLLSEILGQFIGVGVIILAIVFQQELRKFLMMIGRSQIVKNKGIFKLKFSKIDAEKLNIISVVKSCYNLSKSKTGAIIVITKIDDLAVFTESGVEINARISTPMLESIFYKNSPMHDGAVIIRNNNIISARCVLPVSNNESFPSNLGMRHRAASGITEESDSIVIVVSEQTGGISFVKDGILTTNCSKEKLTSLLSKEFKST